LGAAGRLRHWAGGDPGLAARDANRGLARVRQPQFLPVQPQFLPLHGRNCKSEPGPGRCTTYLR
jgi:hypothetical protein